MPCEMTSTTCDTVTRSNVRMWWKIPRGTPEALRSSVDRWSGRRILRKGNMGGWGPQSKSREPLVYFVA